MYGLDINFLKDRAEQIAAPTPKKKASLPASAMVPLFAGLAAMLVIPGLVGGFWLWVNWRTSQVQDELNNKSAQLSTLQAETAEVQQLQQEIELARTQTNALVNVFSEVRSWSAILQDVRDRVPEGTTIESFEQVDNEQQQATPPPEGEVVMAPPPTMEIQGFALSYNQINDFLLTLKDSEFFDNQRTYLVETGLVDYPNPPQGVTMPQVVDYTIRAQLADVPEDELLSVLERKGAFGLAERVRAARNFQQEGGTTQ
ncbi:MAG: PilN domain-containing protein [Spirulinaceae cyanobacterium]